MKSDYSYFVKNNILVLEKGGGLNHQKATTYYFQKQPIVDKITPTHITFQGFLTGFDNHRLKRQATAKFDYLWVVFHHFRDRMYFDVIDHDGIKHTFIAVNHLKMVVEAIENHFVDKPKFVPNFIPHKVHNKYYPYIRKYLTGNKRYYSEGMVTKKVNDLIQGYSDSPVGKKLEKTGKPQTYDLAPVGNPKSAPVGNQNPVAVRNPRKPNETALNEAVRLIGEHNRKSGNSKVIERKDVPNRNEAVGKAVSIVNKVDNAINKICDVVFPFGRKK